MIISHKHQFIFIHCRKVAGSALSAYLAKFLGDDDLQIGCWSDAYDRGVLPNSRAWRDIKHPLARCNYYARLVLKNWGVSRNKRIVEALNGAQKIAYTRVLGPVPDHPTAATLKAFAPIEWKTYFKFCFVRNPFERVISDYRWRTRKMRLRPPTFKEYLQFLDKHETWRSVVPLHYDNWPMYAISDAPDVDFIGRYEHLSEDFDKVLKHIGINGSGARLPIAKRLGERQDLKDWYGPVEQDLVERIFQRELEYFGYSLNG